METTSAVPSNTLRVDTHLAKFSQAGTVLLSALAFLLNQPVIVAITAIILLLQGVGAAFLIASSLVLFLTSATAVGWALDLIVFVLAGINLTVGFCTGCFVYYHLGRMGVLPRVRYEGGFHWRGV